MTTRYRASLDQPRLGISRWCAGSLSLHTPWREFCVHYPPALSPAVAALHAAVRAALVATLAAAVWLAL